MKTIKIIAGIVSLMTCSVTLLAQEKNLVMNGSFENTSGRVQSTGAYILADSISSSNNTTVDLFSKDARGNDYDIPVNYMGTNEAKGGNNYAGFIAYYADDAGIFKTKPGYRKYSEYVQFGFSEKLEAGRAYRITFNLTLAEKSAYAVSGLGVYFSAERVDVKNNQFLNITPHFVTADVIKGEAWSTFSGVYVAKGNERYITLGCFDKYMTAEKVISENMNNSRKAYYYIDEVSVNAEKIKEEELVSILNGSCYQLNDLNFETDKSVILSASFPELNSLSLFLKNYPYVTVYIDGHTDKTGSDQHNDKLSKDRALAVKTYLVNEGVDISRLMARGYGESNPVDLKNENSRENRRVEITVCDGSKN